MNETQGGGMSILPVLLRSLNRNILSNINLQHGDVVHAEVSPSKRWISLHTTKRSVVLLFLSDPLKETEKQTDHFVLQNFVVVEVQSFVWVRISKKNNIMNEASIIDCLVCVKENQGIIMYNLSESFHSHVSNNTVAQISTELVELTLEKQPFPHFSFSSISKAEDSVIPSIFLSYSSILHFISELQFSKEQDTDTYFKFQNSVKIQSVDEGKYVLLSNTKFPSFLTIRPYEDNLFIVKHLSIEQPRLQTMTYFTSKQHYIFILSTIVHRDNKSQEKTVVPVIEIWDLKQGIRKSYIDIGEVFEVMSKDRQLIDIDDRDPSASIFDHIDKHEFKSISVSDDLSTISLHTVKGIICLFDINEYFQYFPSRVLNTAEKSFFDVRNTSERNEHVFPPQIMIFNFENAMDSFTSVQLETNLPQANSEFMEKTINVRNVLQHSFSLSNQKRRSNMGTGNSTWFHNQSNTPLASNSVRVSWESSSAATSKINGFNYFHQKKKKKLSENSEEKALNNSNDEDNKQNINIFQVKGRRQAPRCKVFLPSPTISAQGKSLERVDITPSCLIAHFAVSDAKGDPQTIICFFDRSDTQQKASYHLERFCFALDYNTQSLYVYDDTKGIVVLLFGQQQSQLLHNLVMFGNAKSADSLCALNDWDRSALRIHTLHLGLQYRQISVIETAIDGITQNQQWKSTSMLLQYLNENRPQSFDEFYMRLIKLSMKFVHKLLQEKIQNVLTKEASSLTLEKNLSNIKDVLPVGSPLSSSPTENFFRSVNQFLQQQYETDEEAVLFFSRVLSYLRGLQISAPTGRRKPSTQNLDINANLSSLESLNVYLLSYQPNHSLSKYEDKWHDVDDIDVLRDSLLTGNLSSAYCYLLRKKLNFTSFEQFQKPSQSVFTFEDLRQNVFAIVYQELVRDRLNIAEQLIVNLGESLYDVLYEVLFNTSRRSLRKRLIAALTQIPYSQNNYYPSIQSPEIAELIKFAKKLEKAYSNPSYTLEYAKRLPKKVEPQPKPASTSFFRRSSTDVRKSPNRNQGKEDDLLSKLSLTSGELDDITKSVELEFGFELMNTSESPSRHDHHNSKLKFPRILIPANSDFDPNTLNDPKLSGYAHFTLAWLEKWSNDTKERVLIDREYHSNERSSGALLQHYISRYNWRRLNSWVLKLPIQYNFFHQYFGNKKLSEISEVELLEKLEQLTEQSLPVDLWTSIVKSLLVATPFIKDFLLSQLARRGVFVEIHSASFSQKQSNVGAAVAVLDCNSNSKRWASVLSRLGKIGNLFFTNSNNASAPKQLNNNDEVNESLFLLSKLLSVGEITYFHKEIIYSLLQLNVPNVIQSFLDYYKLDANSANPKYFLPSHVNDHDIPPWFNLLIQIRKGEDLYQASLINAHICLNQSSPVSYIKHQKPGILAEMLKSGRILMLLGTLAYSNSTMENTIREEESQGELQMLRDIVKKSYPSLYPIFNTTNNPSNMLSQQRFNEDKILREMLQLLEKSSPFVIEKIPDISFSNPSLVKFAYKDSIDISYYLSKGQPVKAFQLFLSQPAGVTKDQIPSIIWNILWKNSVNKNVISSCLAFLDMCEVDSIPFLINIKAAQRIFSHLQTNLEIQSNSTLKLCEAFFNIILGYLKSPASKKVSEANLSTLNQFLQLLIDATTHLPNIWFKENEQGVFYGITSEWEEGYISKWHLVVLFCRLHSLEIYTNHLRDLAIQNEWVQFLYEAQIQRIGSEKIFELLPSFTDNPLREHLTVVINNISSNLKRKNSSSNNAEMKEENIFDILLSVEKDPRGAINMLLLKCCSQKRPLLAVIAAHYKNDIIEDCLLSWLFSQCYKSLSENITKKVLSYFHQNYFSPDIFEAVDSDSYYIKDNNSDSLDSGHNIEILADVLVELCSTKQLVSVIEGIGTFDPQNPLLLYLHFHRCFLQSKFVDADRYFIEFCYILSPPETATQLQSLSSPKFKQYINNVALDQYKINIGDKDWVKMLATRLVHELQKKCPSDYELNRLLSLLSKVQFDQSFVHQFTIFKLIQNTNINASIMSSPIEIVSILIEKGLYKQARDYCIEAKLPKVEHDRVILNECRTLLEQYEKGGLWQIYTERLNFWKKAQSLLAGYNCSPSIAGEFFNALAQRYHTSAQEYITLLSYSLEWFKQIPEHERPEHISIKDLDMRITILSAAGDGVDYILPDREWSFTDVDSELLDRIIGSLLNAEKLQKAEEIAAQFNYSNIELLSIKTEIGYAEGVFASPRDFPPEVTKRMIEVLRNTQRHEHDIDAEGAETALARSSKEEIFQLIIDIISAGKVFAKKIFTRWKIANALNLTYTVMDSKDPYQTLSFLIYRGSELLEEARLFIDLYALDVKRVSQLLADTFFKSIYYNYDKSPGSSSNNSGGSRSFQAGDDQMKLNNFIIRTINPNQTSTEFTNFVSLSKEPRYVGDRFIELFKSAGRSSNNNHNSENESDYEGSEREFQILASSPLSDETKVELLVRAYHCYHLSDYSDGVDRVIQLVLHTMAPGLIKQNSLSGYKLVVRLLLGIRNYLELQQLFNTIVENGYFELLLKRDTLNDESERMELQQALYCYLRNKLPRDTKKVEMMFLSFRMWREMADTYYTSGMKILQDIGVFDPRNFSQISRHLTKAMELLLDASDNYVKEKCYIASKECLNIASLIGLQLQTPSVCFINLPATESRRIMELLAYFEDALIFAEAYNYNTPEVWLNCLYKQVILSQNYVYLEKYLENMPTPTSQLWVDITRMYKNDRQVTANSTSAFKYFLSQLDDEFLKYKIASDLGFKEFQLPKSLPIELYNHFLHSGSSR